MTEVTTTRFVRPGSLEEAVGILRDGPGKWTLLAGGTDLLVRMRDGAVRPEGVIDLTGVREMSDIGVVEGHVVVGALVTHARLAGDDVVRRHGMALAEAADLVGSPQIRNRGTLGGNVMNASPAADAVPPLFVLAAEIRLVGPAGERWVPVDEFATGPGITVKREDEILAAVRFEAEGGTFRSRFARMGTRKALAIAKVSVAIGARRAGPGGDLDRVRVALGAVAPTVIRARKAETLLEGARLSEATIEAAAAAVMDEARPISDIRSTAEYRREMCGVLTRRLLNAAEGE